MTAAVFNSDCHGLPRHFPSFRPAVLHTPIRDLDRPFDWDRSSSPRGLEPRVCIRTIVIRCFGRFQTVGATSDSSPAVPAHCFELDRSFHARPVDCFVKLGSTDLVQPLERGGSWRVLQVGLRQLPSLAYQPSRDRPPPPVLTSSLMPTV